MLFILQEQLAHILATKKDNSLNEIKQNSNKLSSSISTSSTPNQNNQMQTNQNVSLQPPTYKNKDLKATRKHVDNENNSNGIDLNS